jgi:hypothetical protein
VVLLELLIAEGSGFRDSCAFPILVKIAKQRRITIIILGGGKTVLFWFILMEPKGIDG